MSAKLTIPDRLAARTPQGALARARMLQESGHHQRAFNLLAIAAQAGIAEAESEVGRHYMTGEGVVRNTVEAARWFMRAAEKGDNQAQRLLAALHMFGLPEGGITSADTALFTEAQSPKADFDTALRYALPAAEAGDVEAQVMAGFMLTTGPEHLHDEKQALFWFAKAAEAGSPQGHLGLGITTLHKAETDEATFAAVDHIRQAADADLGTGHYYLAIIYENAIGVLPDRALATKHYGLAAKAGIRNAQAKYGDALLNGIGIKANRIEGETWLRRAGLAGDMEAAFIVANFYTNTDGDLPPSYAEAAGWFRIAAEGGHSDAARSLGMLYLTGAGVPRDPDEAAIWFRRAAEAGDPAAQSDLASLLLSGRTNPTLTEPPPVHEWFEQAAEAGDPVGAFNYAVCLAQGVGVPQDEARAAVWFRRAAENVLNAQYWYGRILAEGRGVEANPEEARVWLQKAADLELPEALVDLASLHLNGLGGPRDHEAARLLYERAAARGHAGAMFSLGAMYGGGHDIPTDRALSLSWYRAGAEQGHPMAALMLGKYLHLGIATPPDADAAKHWFTQALNGGITAAQAELKSLEPPDAAAAE
ncbi:MAG TPA: tetratricopeptide repeat protein [Acidocella sp.]|nr:tetratricopeptide repeat protein [Acidocella sp.]